MDHGARIGICRRRLGRKRVNVAPLSAAAAGAIGCDACGLVSKGDAGFCPRCGEALHSRRPNSIQIVWALIIAAAICYVPANALPVLTTTNLGSSEEDTILGGVLYLYQSGSWPLALIVLVASVMIPLGKLLVLAYLLIKIQHGRVEGGHEQARLFKIVGVIGRWSMLDVFVGAYTVALVQLQPLMSVAPGPGIAFFAAVVILTMLAAEYFDPRLIWDAASRMQPRHVR
jgi:paraquat-inducible protein A